MLGLVEFVETSVFTRQIDQLLTEDERGLLMQHLVNQPRAGGVIPGSGGLRKLRWSASGRGKRGGARIIYYLQVSQSRVLLLSAFANNERSALTKEQVKTLRRYVESELCNEG